MRCAKGMMVVAFVVVALFASSAFAQDWPQWRGADRDGKAAFNAPAAWPAELKEAWKVTVGIGDASPALVDGKLYVFARQGDDEVIRCLNAADGKEIWKAGYPAEKIGGPAARQHSGPRSSPAVAQGKVVTLGVAGVLSCLNAADGSPVWRKNDYEGSVPQFYTSASPMIVDGMVIALLGGKGKGALMAYDLATGDVKWKCDGQPAMYSSPALMTAGGVKQVVAMSERSVFGAALADGKLLWEAPFVPQGRAYNAATPVVDGQNVIVSGQGRGTLCLKIEKEGDGFAAKEQWKSDTAVQFNTPVLKDGRLFGLTDRSNLFCINAKDGQVLWTDDTARGRGGYAEIVDAGSALVALPNTSELLVYKPTDKGYEQIAAYKVAESQTYAYPVLAGEGIYVQAGDTLTLWTLK